MSDVIDRFTCSSSKCFEYLSAFGVTVSKSTFQRFQTSVAAQEMTQKSSVISRSFCVASVDNIDRDSCFSAVVAGQEKRGFHGTSVQAVEPLPDTLSNATVVIPTDSLPSQSNHSRQLDRSVVEEYHQGSLIFHPQSEVHTQSHRPLCKLTINHFSLTDSEEASLEKISEEIFFYMFVKFLNDVENLSIPLPDLKSSVSHDLPPSSLEQSAAHYTCILAEPADNQETIRHTIDILHKKHNVGKSIKFLVVAGDGKTYEHLLEAKRQYGETLDWLLPYLGEWHLLKNTQAPLLKIYLDAGLKDMLKLFHRASTFRSVSSASSFRKTHIFLMQAWEAMYRKQLAAFHKEGRNHNVVLPQLMKSLVHKLKKGLIDSVRSLQIFSYIHSEFKHFISEREAGDATFQFWSNFIHRDMFNYVSLFLAIRHRRFTLRTAAIKSLAPIYHALDRQCYLKWVPHHLASLHEFPASILTYFEKGAFAVNISGRVGCCVALDEAHEMLINKEVKMAMNSCKLESLSRMVHYLSYRSKVLAKVDSIVKANSSTCNDTGDYFLASFSIHEKNVQKYVEKLDESKVLFKQNEQSSDLIHVFSGLVPHQTVTADLLTFYEQGLTDLQAYIKCVILKTANQKPPIRRKRNLKTFSVKKKTVHKAQLELKDHKLQISSLRRQIAISKSSCQPVPSLDQFVALPRAICSAAGIPNKASKSKIAKDLQRLYPGAFSDKVPRGLIGDRTCCILEGMFMINCPPLAIHKSFGEYASFLYRRWVEGSMKKFHANEVHILFDDPLRHGVSPKDIERARRDLHHADDNDISCTLDTIESATPCPNDWRKFISNRTQKRILVNFLSKELLLVGKESSLKPELLVVAGGFDNVDKDKAYAVSHDNIFELQSYQSNHEEGDTRTWLHCHLTKCQRIIIYSPDRDTFHVGLPFIDNWKDKHVFVQLNVSGEDFFVSMSDLCSLLQADLSFQSLGSTLIAQLPLFLQMVYIVSGCDFTSFFHGHSKKQFLDVFQRDCFFITGEDSKGLLSHFCNSTFEKGLLAFYRLIGSVYFRSYSSAFEEGDPQTLFHTKADPLKSLLDNHLTFLNVIRDGHFHRISSEAEWMPSVESLRLHWMRCCWVATVWGQAYTQKMVVPSITDYGWELKDGKADVVWDTEENIRKTTERVQSLRVGCKCSKGCINNWCKCRKQGNSCTVCCLCKNCINKGTCVPQNYNIQNASYLSTHPSDTLEEHISSQESSDEEANTTDSESGEDRFLCETSLGLEGGDISLESEDFQHNLCINYEIDLPDFGFEENEYETNF